ncbi:hypothetical protein COV17_00105 [Candidatus Woesearchaeota archaeon CG10_big_fil_rev_8_21_14_0_10_36_11]|nr:MAG: hypothetical protein COV17_00105 [Candidatus Woesearchaeota archaeon CG10_big_fil_rev_8_21_14_0_10_36_11]
MFTRIQKLFRKQKPVPEETVPVSELQVWFNTKVSQIGLDEYLQEYFTKINNIKIQLHEKIPVLQHQEIAEKDKKQVEDRVKNIVTGHKQHYCREMERFTDNILSLNKEWKTLEEYQDAIKFNTTLDTEIDELAKRTHKSYQATQHLFFDVVQDVFKSMGELNLLVKDFKKIITKYNIEKFTEIQHLITTLHEETEKEKWLKRAIQEQNEQRITITHKTQQIQKKYNELIESKEYKDYIKLEEKQKQLDTQYKDIEHQIFSYFSKLSKALKKYEYIALKSKQIQPYIDNSVHAFWDDTELHIIQILQGIHKNSTKLNLDEKQQKNIVPLIEKAEAGYLNELKEKGHQLQQEKQFIQNSIEQSEVWKEVETSTHQLNTIRETAERMKNELESVTLKVAKISTDTIKKDLCGKAAESLNVILKLI